MLQPALFDNSVGPELVTNGTFDTDTSGWTAGNSATLSVSSGRLRVTSAASPLNGFAYQTIATEIGRIYRITANTYAGTASSRRIRVGTSAGGFQNAEVTNQDVDTTFKATATTTYVSCYITALAGGRYAEFDNVSVRVQPFYAATVDLGDPPALTPSLLTNSQTFHAPRVAFSIRPALLTNTQSFYAPLVAGEQVLTVSLLSNSQAFYSFTVAGAGTLRPSLFDNSAAGLFDDALFDPALFDTGQGFLGATLAVGVVTLQPSLLTNTQTFFAGDIPALGTLLPELFANTNAIYLPGVWGRTVSTEPSWSGADGEDSDWTPVTPTDASWAGGNDQETLWTPVIPTDGSWA